jgi:hypothetical protein
MFSSKKLFKMKENKMVNKNIQTISEKRSKSTITIKNTQDSFKENN